MPVIVKVVNKMHENTIVMFTSQRLIYTRIMLSSHSDFYILLRKYRLPSHYFDCITKTLEIVQILHKVPCNLLKSYVYFIFSEIFKYYLN